jgi:hypothetical protein
MEVFKYGQIEIDYLKKKDKKLGEAIERIGMIEREVIPDLFAALISSIVAQQISAKAADTVWNRMLERFGEVTPERLTSVSVEEVQQCGLSMRKANYIKGIVKNSIFESRLCKVKVEGPDKEDAQLMIRYDQIELTREVTCIAGDIINKKFGGREITYKVKVNENVLTLISTNNDFNISDKVFIVLKESEFIAY